MARVKFHEHFYQTTFPNLKNIYGLIAMHGLTLGKQWIYILKLVKTENWELLSQSVQDIEFCQELSGYLKLALIKTQNYKHAINSGLLACSPEK